MSRNAGRLVLITGASSGIGRAAALAFARRGDRVLAVARGRERLAALSAEHPGVVPLEADVADGPSMASLAERVLAERGVPDVVIANAGVGLDALFAETPDDALRRLLEVNVIGVFRTVRPFLPPMLARRTGRVLLVSSIVGKRGVPHYAGYSGSKFALHGVADALRAELWGSGVSVGVVCPASTETPFRDHVTRVGPAQRGTRPVRRSAESVARALVAMAASRRRERVLGAEAKLLVLADHLLPGLVDWLLCRTLTRRREVP
jgi:short-subunit dehydrogenase